MTSIANSCILQYIELTKRGNFAMNSKERDAIKADMIATKICIEQALSGIVNSWNEYRNIMIVLDKLFKKHPGLLSDFKIENDFEIPRLVSLQDIMPQIRGNILNEILPVMNTLSKAKENNWGLSEKSEANEAYAIIALVSSKCTAVLKRLPKF